MRAVGLTLADLFDEPLDHHRKSMSVFQRRRQDQARNALKALKHECIVVWCMSEQMRAGFSLDPDQHDRLELALDRIARAAEIAA